MQLAISLEWFFFVVGVVGVVVVALDFHQLLFCVYRQSLFRSIDRFSIPMWLDEKRRNLMFNAHVPLNASRSVCYVRERVWWQLAYVYLSTKIEVNKYNWDIICHYAIFCDSPFAWCFLYCAIMCVYTVYVCGFGGTSSANDINIARRNNEQPKKSQKKRRRNSEANDDKSIESIQCAYVWMNDSCDGEFDSFLLSFSAKANRCDEYPSYYIARNERREVGRYIFCHWQWIAMMTKSHWRRDTLTRRVSGLLVPHNGVCSNRRAIEEKKKIISLTRWNVNKIILWIQLNLAGTMDATALDEFQCVFIATGGQRQRRDERGSECRGWDSRRKIPKSKNANKCREFMCHNFDNN